jgi:radical SAM protein with 4Fe4S-binding SPASM domain
MDDLENFGRKVNLKIEILFTGGDPLLREDFFKIVKYARNKGFSFRVLGNPYHLDEKVAKELKKLGIKAYQLSLDGLEKTHDFIRKKGSFKKTLRALKILKKVGIESNVLLTLSKINVKDLIPLMKLVSKIGVDVFSFGRLTPFGNCKIKKNDILSPKELRDILLDVLFEIIKLKKNGSKTRYHIRENLFYLLLKELNILPKLPQNNIVYDGCSIGIDSLAILPDGIVYPCRRLPIKIGKVPEEKIVKIFFESKELNKLREVNKIEKCKDCYLFSICRGCRAVAYAINKNPMSADPQCWRR